MVATKSIVAINPATEEEIAQYEPDDDRVDAALDLSVSAFVEWKRTSFAHRADLMRNAAKVLRARSEEYARLMTAEMGKPIAQSRAEVEKCAWGCEFYADHAEEFLRPESVGTDAKTASGVRYDPLGTVLAIMPWNFPFWQVFRFIAPTIMAGNTGILKHASNVPGSSRAIEELMIEAGFPRGVFQSLLVGSGIATSMIGDDRIAAVTLTGSEGAGRSVGAAAGQAIKPCVLELGGSDPFIILADADLDAAISAGVTARTLNGGQSCICAKRFIIEDSVYDQVIEGMRAKMSTLKVGDPLQDDTDIGPMAKDEFVDDLVGQVEASIAEGGRVILGGKRPEGRGYYFEPTLVADSKPGMTIMREETFGPVAALARAKDAEEAVRIANDSRFGLGSSLWTTPDRAEGLIPQIEAGHVAVNGITKSDPRLPFGGVKRSGIGRELSKPGILAFMNTKAVWVG